MVAILALQAVKLPFCRFRGRFSKTSRCRHIGPAKGFALAPRLALVKPVMSAQSAKYNYPFVAGTTQKKKKI